MNPSTAKTRPRSTNFLQMALTLDGASEEEGGVHPNRKVGVFGLSKESMRDMCRVDFFLQMAVPFNGARKGGAKKEWR